MANEERYTEQDWERFAKAVAEAPRTLLVDTVTELELLQGSGSDDPARWSTDELRDLLLDLHEGAPRHVLVDATEHLEGPSGYEHGKLVEDVMAASDDVVREIARELLSDDGVPDDVSPVHEWDPRDIRDFIVDMAAGDPTLRSAVRRRLPADAPTKEEQERGNVCAEIRNALVAPTMLLGEAGDLSDPDAIVEARQELRRVVRLLGELESMIGVRKA